MKFLEKKELKGFNFQRTFLRPFETMMKLSKSSLIRELIIMIINQMVVARSANIESGWQVIFDVLAATVKDAVLVKEAFVIVKRLITDDFALVSGQVCVVYSFLLLPYNCTLLSLFVYLENIVFAILLYVRTYEYNTGLFLLIFMYFLFLDFCFSSHISCTAFASLRVLPSTQ